MTAPCGPCASYAATRLPTLASALARRCEETGETSQEIVDRFMAGVHDRHLSGLPILTETAEVPC